MSRRSKHGAVIETQRPMACCALIAVLVLAVAVGAIWFGWSKLDLPWEGEPETFPGADRMVRISLDVPEATPGDVTSWFAGQAVLELVVPWRPVSETLTRGEDVAPSLAAAEVSEEFFAAVDVEPLLGRSFVADDFVRGDVIVLEYWTWYGWLGGDFDIIGSTLALGDAGEQEVVVVGVMPDGFSFPNYSRFWLPVGREGDGGVEIFGKLRPGTSVELAQGDLERVLARNLPGEFADAAASLRVEAILGD